MKYINAAEILPEKLLKEIQRYIDGGVLLIITILTACLVHSIFL